MNSTISTSISALNAVGTKMESSANNIANANTDGFRKTTATMAATAPQGVRAEVQRSSTPGSVIADETGNGYRELSNVDPAEELIDMRMSSHMYSANLQTIKTVDEMLSRLLDLKA